MLVILGITWGVGNLLSQLASLQQEPAGAPFRCLHSGVVNQNHPGSIRDMVGLHFRTKSKHGQLAFRKKTWFWLSSFIIRKIGRCWLQWFFDVQLWKKQDQSVPYTIFSRWLWVICLLTFGSSEWDWMDTWADVRLKAPTAMDHGGILEWFAGLPGINTSIFTVVRFFSC